MIKKIFLAAAASILLILSSCNSNPVIPPEDKPGRRDYTWRVDTVNYPDGVWRLWGSSPLDLWAVSGGGDLYRTIWHYDSTSWSTDNVFRRYAPQCVFGFSKDIVFMGGTFGRIWQLHGWTLTEIAALTKDGHNNIDFDNMWGESPNDFYAFGAYSDERGAPINSVIPFHAEPINFQAISAYKLMSDSHSCNKFPNFRMKIISNEKKGDHNG